MSAVPTVYFIDDSATMREVIKIAFRRENINVVAAQDAGLALADIAKTRPDVVITDVIMPEKDGYEVCQFIKTHPELAKTPVILMSGVVNRAVAERAFAVKADELLRKPFQPQDLIARVRHLLNSTAAVAPSPAVAANAAVALSGIFSAPTAMPAKSAIAAPAMQRAVASANGMSPAPANGAGAALHPAIHPPVVTPPAVRPTNGNESGKSKVEVLRLEGLVKKLQAELQAEREYSRALEAHIKTLQEAEK